MCIFFNFIFLTHYPLYHMQRYRCCLIYHQQLRHLKYIHIRRQNITNRLFMISKHIYFYNIIFKRLLSSLLDFKIFMLFIIQSLKTFYHKLEESFKIFRRRRCYKNIRVAEDYSGGYSQTHSGGFASSSSSVDRDSDSERFLRNGINHRHDSFGLVQSSAKFE